MKLDHPPQYAFGIKHSPYIGVLKGDDFVPARTEVMTSPPTLTNGNSESKTVVQTSQQNGNVTSQTRTHSDGHRIRTETFTYTKGPTTRITTTTTTSTQQVAQAVA